MAKISVVIPLFNKEPHVKRTLNSVLNQTIQDFEVIVVDGGSSDNGPVIIENFASTDSRVKLIQQVGTGVSDARNQGISESKSDLIAFLDADDEWIPNYLETILRLRQNYPYAGLYATSIKNEFTDNVLIELDEVLRKLIPKEGLILNYFEIYKHGHGLFGTSSVTVPSKVFQELGGFQTDFWWGEDVDMWGRIALKCPIAYSSEVCAIYYQNVVNSAVTRKKIVPIHPFVKTAREALLFNEVPSNIRTDFIEYANFLEMFTAKHNIKAGDKNLAFNVLRKKNTKFSYKVKLLRVIFSTSFKNFLSRLYVSKK